MSAQVTLQDLSEAKNAQDPELVNLLVRLVSGEDPPDEPPHREGAYTFERFLRDQQTPAYRQKSLPERAQFRMEKLAALESPDAEIPLPDKLRCHEVLMDLWQSDDLFSRNCLLEVIHQVPMVYGPFKALKLIFKEAEAVDDLEVFGALAARFDYEFSQNRHGVSQKTLGYLVRRGWRYLRRIGESFPALYADTATDFLIHYRGYAHEFQNTWIMNQIFYHEMKIHSRTKFKFGWQVRQPRSLRKYRAFDELWKRSPRPLFTLLERAKSDHVIQYAADALKSDFRATLRDVQPSWVARLISLGNETIDGFVVWILENVPQFEQSKFRELQLHDAVLKLFDSGNSSVRTYAANYGRTHARDLPVERLVELANSDDRDVRGLAVDLFQSRDPRKEIGLDAWGQLLATYQGYEIAEEALRKHFGARELTPKWFVTLLLSTDDPAREFGQKRLLELHPRNQLGWEYFAGIIAQVDPDTWEHRDTTSFCCDQLEKLGLDDLPQQNLQEMFLHPHSDDRVTQWIDEGKLKASALGVEFLKTVADKTALEASPQIRDLQKRWGDSNVWFSESRAERVFQWLQDVRQFMPSDLGFDWLLELVGRSQPLYHKFAKETMTKIFLPADFASVQDAGEASETEVTDDEIQVDLGGATFVFTGKLATMTRGEAQGKVTTAGGANSNSVTKKLDYLVIGDEGSPLYGQGRKGSKQTKGEKLNEEGASIKIISETAFLQMLAGEQREFSEDAIQSGCERLWAMMVDEEPDAPLARFARAYIRHHHPDICLEETDRPVDPGAEIPPEFLTFQRVLPLFNDSRLPHREFALELAHWEFARWAPPIDGLVTMCESPYAPVRDFVAEAMTVEDSPEHRRYRIDPDVLTADAVYSFCESRNRQTRQLGMKLIDMHPRLRLPEELFRLTESPDPSVRGFVLRTFWSLYHERGTTAHWKPTPPAQSTIKKKRRTEPIEQIIGTGAPERPESLPSDFEQMNSLLRRILFEVPPGRPPKQDGSATDRVVRMRKLPARQSKLNLIETLRDFAIQDDAFAQQILPLLQEFRHSRGQSERAACLVAVTRIQHHHQHLREA